MKKRRIGIPGVEEAGWGEHICVFFYTKDELLKLTAPYIKAGLEDNEFCMWITGDPVTENDAFRELELVLPNAHEYLVKEQLEILPYDKWYLSAGIFEPARVLRNWALKAAQAQANGFTGVRITGNPFWMRSETDWEQFDAYEKAVTLNITNERVIALCTYPIDICQSTNVRKVLSSHRSTLIGYNEYWQQQAIPQL